MTDKLKPCPFCDEKENLYIGKETWHPLSCTWDYRYFITCYNCGLTIRGENRWDRDMLIDKWNTRHINYVGSCIKCGTVVK